MPTYKKLSSGVAIRLHGRSTFLNSREDMAWLRDVHLPGLSAKYKSALVFGNEDYPERIQVYEKKSPLVYDQPATFVPEGDE